MTGSFLSSLLEQYQWQLSLYAGLGIIAASLAGMLVASRIPVLREAGRLNRDTFKSKMERPAYAANQRWNGKWGMIFMAVIFGLILPFCLTLQAQPWWKMLLDVVVILMVYDFVYYVTHRFLFHDRPLMWMHAIHHRQHNPCRKDSSYIHPLEVAIGLGLYVGTIVVLSRFMGPFHVATIIITWFAFSQINLHNHNLWETDRFPFRYLAYASRMHHNHHKNFTGGNYATITLLYDWMLGTLDHGEGGKGRAVTRVQTRGT